MKIEFLPGSTKALNVVGRLTRTIKVAEAIKGCVAFWVIEQSLFGNAFSKLIGKNNSFYCIDIHKPTDINRIQDSFSNGATNIYLYLFKANPSKLYPSLPNHLLHAKIMIFNLPDQKAEIWIGSHNLTSRALKGPNKEASIVITCDQDSDFYKEVESYLLDLKSDCYLYNPEHLGFYKSLQNGTSEQEEPGEIITTVQILGNNINDFANQTILLLGDDTQDLKSLGEIGDKILVNALDLRGTEQELFFMATLENKGRLDESDPRSYGIEFSGRPVAIRRFPFIAYQGWRKKEFGPNALKNFKYFANIKITGVVEGARIEPNNQRKESLWHKETAFNPYFDNFRKEKESNLDDYNLEEKVVIFKAYPPDRTLTLDLGHQLLLRASNTLKAALTRSDRELVIKFYKKFFDLPYFDLKQGQRNIQLILPNYESSENRFLKEFVSKKLGRKMCLIYLKT